MRSRHFLPTRAAALLAAVALAAAGCAPAPESADAPDIRLAGVLLDMQLKEISGLAASATHPDVLWLHDDGGNPARLFAVTTAGRRVATYGVDGVTKTDWEDLEAFELDGRQYLLLADTGDNGGLRRTLQLHVIEEPAVLRNDRLRPAWSVAFRWPDGPRDVEAVAVDPGRGEVLLVSKKREPAELFVLPLRPPARELVTARPLGTLAGLPVPSPAATPDVADAGQAGDDGDGAPKRARLEHQVTAASVSPGGHALAVMTYRYLLLYDRAPGQSWGAAVAGQPRTSVLPWLPQAEALGWAADGASLYATGEFIPAPLYQITPSASIAGDDDDAAKR